jgi:hypothetical protein
VGKTGCSFDMGEGKNEYVLIVVKIKDTGIPM